MKRTVVAGLLGGLVLFAWSAVSWRALSFHEAALRPIPEGDRERREPCPCDVCEGRPVCGAALPFVVEVRAGT